MNSISMACGHPYVNYFGILHVTMVTDVINLIGPFIWTSGCDPMYNCQYLGKGLVINYGEGGLQNGKIAGPKLFAPPPQDRVKPFVPPLLKSGNFS